MHELKKYKKIVELRIESATSTRGTDGKTLLYF